MTRDELPDGPDGFAALGVEAGLEVLEVDVVTELSMTICDDVPLLVTDAELDPDMFQDETNKLAAARASAGKPVERVHLKSHSHISETYAVGTGDRSLSMPVLQFVRRVSGANSH